MLAMTDAPSGANAPALPIAPAITWHRLSEMWSATSAERAFVGPYELIAFDIPPTGAHPRIIAWEMHAGPNFMTGIAGAPADSFESAKVTAEQEARRLLGVPATVARTDSDGGRSRIIPACVKGLPKRDPQPKALPDAVLLAAWDGYIAAMRAYDRACEVPGGSDKDHEPFSRALFAFGGKIEETPALTMAGVAIQLRYLFAALLESPDAQEAAIFRKTHSEELAVELTDARYRMLWAMIQTAEKAGGAE